MPYSENPMETTRAGVPWTMRRYPNAISIVRGLLPHRSSLVDRGLVVEPGVTDLVKESREIEAFENEGGQGG